MATTDVMQKAKNANAIYNGSSITFVTKNGTISVLHPSKNHAPVPEAVELKLKDRFDDIMYYSN